MRPDAVSCTLATMSLPDWNAPAEEFLGPDPLITIPKARGEGGPTDDVDIAVRWGDPRFGGDYGIVEIQTTGLGWRHGLSLGRGDSDFEIGQPYFWPAGQGTYSINREMRWMRQGLEKNHWESTVFLRIDPECTITMPEAESREFAVISDSGFVNKIMNGDEARHELMELIGIELWGAIVFIIEHKPAEIAEKFGIPRSNTTDASELYCFPEETGDESFVMGDTGLSRLSRVLSKLDVAPAERDAMFMNLTLVKKREWLRDAIRLNKDGFAAQLDIGRDLSAPEI
jgi:hypothetical protein